jgi:uncharacterized delta-60 repeat protein
MKKATLLSITGLLAFGLMFGVNSAQAQAGTLDPSFGTGGTVTTNFGGVSVSPLTAIEQSSSSLTNGNIAVVTGLGNGVPGEENFALVRYTSNGTLIGTTTAAFFNDGINSPSAVAVQSNGNIVVAGTASGTIDQPDVFAIARFTPSGQLDPTFGNGGLVTTDISGVFPTVSAVIVQSNGQIVVGGASASGIRHQPVKTVLVRYNSNGSLDTTFGAGGIVQEPTAVGGEPLALAQLSNGDYLAVSGNQLSPEAGVVVEFSSTGVLQSTITPATVVAASPSTPALVNPVIFQPNGDYIWAETVGNGFQRQAAEAFRFSETGVADPSFTSIKITFGGQPVNEPQALALQSNGQIVVGGMSGLARLNSNGQLDTTFGSGGSLATFHVTGLLIQTDGKIVAIGSSGTDLALARYFAN